VTEKFLGVAHLGKEIAVRDPRTELDFLYLARRGFHVRGLLLFLVDVLAEIHDAANRRGRVGRNFDEVETNFQRERDGLLRIENTELLYPRARCQRTEGTLIR